MKTPPKLELPADAMGHLKLVLAQEDDAMRVIKIQLFSEYFLNEAIAAYLRCDKAGVDRLGMRYAQKVTFLEVAGLLDKDCCDFLRKLNSLRHKVAHELSYKLSAADTAKLKGGFGRAIPKKRGQVDFVRMATFLTGYLDGAVQLARMVAPRIDETG